MRTATAHPSSSSYDIDNSPVEREDEAVFLIHKRVFPRSPSPSRFACARGRILSREGERTAIFIEACIHRGWITWNSDGRSESVVTLVCWRDGGTSVVDPLFNRDRNLPPPCPPSVAPSRTYSYFPPTALYLSALRLVPSQLSEHRHALRGITHRTRVVVIYAACTLVCTYVRDARVRVRANAESGCTMRQVYSAVQSIGKW